MKNECSKKKSCFYENEVKRFGNTLWKQASKISSISYGPEDGRVLVGEWGGRQESGDGLQPECLWDVSSCSDCTLSKSRCDSVAWGNNSTVKHWTCKSEALSWISLGETARSKGWTLVILVLEEDPRSLVTRQFSPIADLQDHEIACLKGSRWYYWEYLLMLSLGLHMDVIQAYMLVYAHPCVHILTHVFPFIYKHTHTHTYKRRGDVKFRVTQTGVGHIFEKPECGYSSLLQAIRSVWWL